MIKSTLKRNQELSQRPRNNSAYAPSRLSLTIIMGYALALEVQSSQQIGKIDILLN